VAGSDVTDSEGRFRLRPTDQKKGLVVGWYKVTLEDLALNSEPRSEDGTILKMPPKRFPDKYKDLLHTPLRQEVRFGTQSVTLNLAEGL
jgi:hypothetical protein